jgi:hypothetical protein
MPIIDDTRIMDLTKAGKVAFDRRARLADKHDKPEPENQQLAMLRSILSVLQDIAGRKEPDSHVDLNTVESLLRQLISVTTAADSASMQPQQAKTRKKTNWKFTIKRDGNGRLSSIAASPTSEGEQ